MADKTENFTPGQIIELEITQFMQHFPDNPNIPTVLLFPPDLPHNFQRAIKYIAMMFNLVVVRLSGEDPLIAVVRQQHLRLPYRENIDDVCFDGEQVNVAELRRKLHQILTQNYTKMILNAGTNIPKPQMYHSAIGGGYPEPRCFCGNKCPYKFPVISKESYPEPRCYYETELENGFKSTLNPYAKEFVPTVWRTHQPIKPRVGIRYFFNSPFHMTEGDLTRRRGLTFDLPQAQDIEEYFGDGTVVLLANQNYEQFVNEQYNMGHIVELYNVNNEDIRNYIELGYMNRPQYIKWCDEHTALLIFGSKSDAEEVVRGMQMRARTLEDGSPLAIIAAYFNDFSPGY